MDGGFTLILLGCLAKVHGFDRGSKITQKSYEIPGFARHLSKFCEQQRGPVLQKTGRRKLFRYRFQNPLLQPFVIMRGLKAGRIPQSLITGALEFSIG
jgi:hypothetical protein